MRISILTASLLLVLSACSQIPDGAHMSRGTPESLLDVSSEVVNLDVRSEQSVDELATWIERDQPTRAEIYCQDGNPLCQQTLDIMDLYGVPYQFVGSPEHVATLIYERVLARDCENRYIDNPINPYHLNHPSFGCSIAANIVQMSTDKQQLVRPNLLDLPDARKQMQAIQNYRHRVEPEASKGLEDSLLSAAGRN